MSALMDLFRRVDRLGLEIEITAGDGEYAGTEIEVMVLGLPAERASGRYAASAEQAAREILDEAGNEGSVFRPLRQ